MGGVDVSDLGHRFRWMGPAVIQGVLCASAASRVPQPVDSSRAETATATAMGMAFPLASGEKTLLPCQGETSNLAAMEPATEPLLNVDEVRGWLAGRQAGHRPAGRESGPLLPATDRVRVERRAFKVLIARTGRWYSVVRSERDSWVRCGTVREDRDRDQDCPSSRNAPKGTGLGLAGGVTRIARFRTLVPGYRDQ